MNLEGRESFVKGLWYQSYKYRAMDKRVRPFLDLEIGVGCDVGGSWLKGAREALYLSTNEMANRLGVSRSAYAKLEGNESREVISLGLLRKAAEAMECELVYGIRPKKRVVFSDLLWRKLIAEGRGHPWVRSRPERLKTRALFAAIRWMSEDPEFRRSQHWNQRR